MQEMSVTADFGDHKYDIGMTDVTSMFHMCYYNSRIWENTYWHGHQILKCPMDMWIYQELIWKIKPDFIIETGTYRGGSALYYAHLFDLQGHGEVITIDVNILLAKSSLPRYPITIVILNGYIGVGIAKN